MARMKGAINLGIGALDQRAALALLNDWDAVAAARRREAEEHMRVMVGALRREIPDWQVDEPLGAWSLWIALPAGSAAAFCQLALSHGVMITPGSPSSPDDDFLEHVRVCFGLPPELLEEGARRLAAAWRDFVPTAVPFSTFVNRGR
jgi:DNA-binding transcriptional MocR family regulator